MTTSPNTPGPRRNRQLDALLDACATAVGQPLPDDARDRIRTLDTNPSPATWNDAYTIVIHPHRPPRTLWHAVARADPRCPTMLPLDRPDALDDEHRWHGYHPTRLTLRIALHQATRSQPHPRAAHGLSGAPPQSSSQRRPRARSSVQPRC